MHQWMSLLPDCRREGAAIISIYKQEELGMQRHRIAWPMFLLTTQGQKKKQQQKKGAGDSDSLKGISVFH